MKNVYGKDIKDNTRLTRHYQECELAEANKDWKQNTTEDYCPKRDISYDDCLNKLGQLEDIEEELGIDLMTLFNALYSEKIYFKKQKYRKGKISYFKRFELVKGGDNILRIIGEVKEQYTLDNYGCEFGIILELKDYGKTWALTKEELEK